MIQLSIQCPLRFGVRRRLGRTLMQTIGVVRFDQTLKHLASIPNLTLMDIRQSIPSGTSNRCAHCDAKR